MQENLLHPPNFPPSQPSVHKGARSHLAPFLYFVIIKDMTRNFVFSEDEFYHIYNRGVDKRLVFLEKSDYKRFIALLYAANSDTPVRLRFNGHKAQGETLPPLSEIQRGDTLVDIGAWCLMPNHFHILIKEKQKDGISLFMQKLLTGYSMYFNKKYERKGTLFDRPFKAKHLDTDNYLKYQYTYIHLNPIGIIESGWKEKKIKNKVEAKKFLLDYPYSSLQDYLGVKREENVIIEPKAFPEYFETLTDFKDMIDEWINFDPNL